MRMSGIIACAIFINFTLGGTTTVSAYNEIIDLGGLDGYPVGYARYINDWGKIVGWVESNDVNDSNTIACLFDNTGGGANINLGGAGSAALCCLSRIVGQSAYYHVYNNPPIYDPNYSRACVFDMAGDVNNIFELGALGEPWPYIPDSSNESGAQSISHYGQIVGYAYDGSGDEYNPGLYLACLFDATGQYENKSLGTLGGYVSEALGNNEALIVGYADNALNYERACIFDPTGDANNNIDLGTLGGDCSGAWSINDSNQIVGWALDSSDNYRACLFDATGDANNNIDLGTLGGNHSEAYFINDLGQAVGYAYDMWGQKRACLFNGGNENIDLNSLVDPNSGWILQYAFGINNDGWIVGSGTLGGTENSPGLTRAFLLKPPMPPTCIAKPIGDLNGDCIVNLADFALIANNWLQCNIHPSSACW
ncbi:MAG: hypothetical protein JW806_05190 [Sedimentisphaerales bacterium]|nr:hypothetical protein [Sedimentisphaerales bacterium]